MLHINNYYYLVTDAFEVQVVPVPLYCANSEGWTWDNNEISGA